MPDGILRTTAELAATLGAVSAGARGTVAAVRSGPLAAQNQFYLTGSEHLQIVSRSMYAPLSVIIVAGRILRASDNTIVPFSIRHECGTAEAPATERIPMSEGALLNVAVYPESVGFSGQLSFVKIQVIQGFEGATTTLGTLIQGYLANNQDLAWPGSPQELMTGGPGILIPYAVWTAPAGNASAVAVVPDYQVWEIVACQWNVVASAVVANRKFVLVIIKAGQSAWRVEHPFALTASAAANVSAGQGVIRNETTAFGICQLPLPVGLRLQGGDDIELQLVNNQVGDAIGGQQMIARSWLFY